MGLVILADALHEFELLIDEVEEFAAFMSAANDLRPHVGRFVNWNNLGSDQQELLKSFVSQKKYRLDVGYNGLMVGLAGGFERYVKRCVRDCVRWLNRTLEKYESAKPGLIHQNLVRTGYALASHGDPPVELEIDFEELCANLATCRIGGGKLVLNADVFSIHVSNLTPDKLNDVLKRIDVVLEWDAFGRDEVLQITFGTEKTREACNKTQDWLKEFIKHRNRIAHTGVGTVQTTKDYFQTAVDVLRAVSKVLAIEVERQIQR